MRRPGHSRGGDPGGLRLVNALAVSGLPTGRFTFEGFLAMNKKNRKAHLESLKHEERTMVFHEAPISFGRRWTISPPPSARTAAWPSAGADQAS